MRGHNNLMYRYKGMDGIKTGFTQMPAASTWSAPSTNNGRRVIGVVLGGKSARSRDARMAELLDEAMPKAATRGGALVGRSAPCATTGPAADLPEGCNATGSSAGTGDTQRG